MENNKEVKIAIIVGIIMITISLLAIIIHNSNTKIEEVSLKVYKNYTTEDGREYRECTLTTDELISIKREYNKATNINEDKKLTGQTITGTYMIKDGDEYIAFDADDSNKVYVLANSKQAIYSLESTMYETVKNACES